MYFQMFGRRFAKLRLKAAAFAYSCGIVGFVGDEPASDYLFEGLQILRNRGYDSAGISTISEGDGEFSGGPHKITTTKFSSVNTSDSLEILQRHKAAHAFHPCGIAHTRWATHGGKTDLNAHPHSDQTGRISLVHNGTIENYFPLKKMLMAKGYSFVSETDTEVIVQLISSFYSPEAKNLVEALTKAMAVLQGTYGLAIICGDFPDRILAVRKGSPLVIGLHENKKWVASEYAAFSRYTKKYVSLNDGEIAVIKKNKISIDTEGRLSNAPHEEVLLSPSPFEFWTLKEIMEQPEAIDRSLNHGGRLCDNSVMLGGLDHKKKVLVSFENLVLAACGSSLYAAQYVAKIMRNLSMFDSVQVVSASEFEMNLMPKNAALLVISQSGETKDVASIVKTAHSNDTFVFGVVNVVGSLVSSMVECGVYTNAGKEHGVASTKTFVTQVVALVLISIWFAIEKNGADVKTESLIKELHNLSTYASIALKTKSHCKRVAKRIHQSDHVFVLGRGYGEAIAREAALKIKEMSYIHAEGFSGGELKHGPFAMIEEGTPIFVILLDDLNANLMKIACEEVTGRGADLYVVTDNMNLTEGLKCEVIKIPKSGTLSALLALIPFQLIAFYASVMKGVNPDKPRNLAKAVTVD